MKHFEQHTFSTLWTVLYHVHRKIKFYIQNCDPLKSDTSAAQKKKNVKKMLKKKKKKKPI